MIHVEVYKKGGSCMADVEKQEPLDGEMIAMGIIASAGDARSYAFGALEEAKKGNFDEADRLLEECKKAGVAAHQAQTELLVAQANGNAPEMTVLLVHAQDHFMTSMLAEELIREIIQLYKIIDK
jgi:PTS system cellobiose-specific IIA component